MKNFLVLLSLLLTSCGCLLSQNIPPQNLYPGTNCTVPIPDYRPFFTITGGCTGFVVTQTPSPGTVLTTSNTPMTVIVKATGTNGKTSQRFFTVALADTVTPKLVPIGILAEVTRRQINSLYDAGDKLFGFIDDNLMSQKWIDSIPGLREHLTSGDIHKRALVNVSYENPDGTRTHNWNFVDSISVFTKLK